jgi:hypothetical protein
MKEGANMLISFHAIFGHTNACRIPDLDSKVEIRDIGIDNGHAVRVYLDRAFCASDGTAFWYVVESEIIAKIPSCNPRSHAIMDTVRQSQESDEEESRW